MMRQWDLKLSLTSKVLCHSGWFYGRFCPLLRPRAGVWFRSRRLGLETVSRRTNVSSRSWEADVSVSSRSRPFTYRAQDQFSDKLCRSHYAVWTGFRRCKPML